MLILVTGANGFIGRHLCRRLRSTPHQVRGLVRPGANLSGLADEPGIELVHGDVLVPESLEPAVAGADVVIHLAGAVAAGRDSTYVRVNVEGTRHLAAACNSAAVQRFVFMSSLSAQGPSEPGQPHRKAGQERPINSFGRSKLDAELALRETLGDSQRATVLRPGVVYGPEDPELAFWGRLVRRRLLPLVPRLELSFLHVDDLTDLMLKLIDDPEPAPGPFLLGDGEVHSLEKVLDLLEQQLSSTVSVRLPVPRSILDLARPIAERLATAAGLGGRFARILGELSVGGWACLPDEARARLGFEPKRRLAEALPEVVAWYRESGWLDHPPSR